MPCRRSSPLLTVLLAGLGFLPTAQAQPAALETPPEVKRRLRELATRIGPQTNVIEGFSLVVGLQGTGDTSVVTQRLFTNRLAGKEALRMSPDDVSSKNLAAVLVQAQLPPHAKPGDTLTLRISAIGGATDLSGGTLLATVLRNPFPGDDTVYATALGGVVATGAARVAVGGQGQQINHPTSGTIDRGAKVIKELPVRLLDPEGKIQFTVTRPASRKGLHMELVERICQTVNQRWGQGVARVQDAGSFKVRLPVAYRDAPHTFLDLLERTEVRYRPRALVLVDENKGIVVATGPVSISPCVIAHGDIRIRVRNVREAVGITPWIGRARQDVVENQEVELVEEDISVAKIGLIQSDLDALGKLFDELQVPPRVLIEVLRAIDGVDALHADLVER